MTDRQRTVLRLARRALHNMNKSIAAFDLLCPADVVNTYAIKAAVWANAADVAAISLFGRALKVSF